MVGWIPSVEGWWKGKTTDVVEGTTVLITCGGWWPTIEAINVCWIVCTINKWALQFSVYKQWYSSENHGRTDKWWGKCIMLCLWLCCTNNTPTWTHEALDWVRAQHRYQLACSCLRLRRAYKLRGSATQLQSHPEDDWSIQWKRWQDKFLCCQVVYKSTVSNFPWILKKYETKAGKVYSQYVQCLGDMAVEGEGSDVLSYTWRWFELVSRGGLFSLNDSTFTFFVAVEKQVWILLPQHVIGCSDKEAFQRTVIDRIVQVEGIYIRSKWSTKCSCICYVTLCMKIHHWSSEYGFQVLYTMLNLYDVHLEEFSIWACTVSSNTQHFQTRTFKNADCFPDDWKQCISCNARVTNDHSGTVILRVTP